MSAKLKPCPFCGSPAEVFDSRLRGGWVARCEAARCGVALSSEGTEDEAVKKWNRRTSEGELTVKRLREIADPRPPKEPHHAG